MARDTKKTAKKNDGNLGFEEKLWAAADKLRSNMDAAEYKHVVLGLIFLKYISDAFEEQPAALVADRADGADPEDPDEYRADEHLLGADGSALGGTSRRRPSSRRSASSSTTRWWRSSADNPLLKGVLPKNYASPAVDSSGSGN